MLGVPCNQFAGQEPGSDADVKWNFAKFLIDRRGAVVARFEPATTPTSPEVDQAIEQALGA